MDADGPSRIRLFRDELEERLRDKHNFEALEKFILAGNHPRCAWPNFLGSRPSKYKSGTATTTSITIGSLMVSHLIEYFPDVIYRELFLDWIKANRLVLRRDQFGALHAAVLCGQLKIVRLFNDNRKRVSEGICLRLTKYLSDRDSSSYWNRSSISEHCFVCITRAILYIHITVPEIVPLDQDDTYERIAIFLRECSRLVNREKLPLGRAFNDASYRNLDEGSQNLLRREITTWATAFGLPVDESQHFEAPEMTEDYSLLWRAVEEVVQIIDRLLNDCRRPYVYDLCCLCNLTYRVSNSRDPIPQDSYNGGWTPFHLAAAVGDHEVLGALIESYDSVLDALPKGWEIKVQSDAGAYPTRVRIDRFIATLRDNFDMTPLHHAALGNHRRAVKVLLEWKSFRELINVKDKWDRTAFQIACSKNDRVSVVEELLKSPEIVVNSKDCHGFTPVHWSVHTGAIDVVRVLASKASKLKGIQMTVKCAHGKHPYRVAEDLKDLEKKTAIQDVLLNVPEIQAGVDRLYRDRQVSVDAANAILVGAALIASVTFGGWLQPPFDNSEVIHRRTILNVHSFWALNSLSFFFAIATVMAGAGAVIPVADVDIESAVDKIRMWLVFTAFLFILSVVFVLGAFTAAGFATLSQDHHVPHLVVNMISTTSFGSIVCGIVWSISFRRFFKIRRINLWRAIHWPMKGQCTAHFIRAFRSIGKLLSDVCCCAPCGGSHETQTSAPRSPNENSTRSLEEILHPKIGEKICGVRQGYLELELRSTVKPSVFPDFETQDDSNQGACETQDDSNHGAWVSYQASIFQFFWDEKTEATLNHWANISPENFGIVEDDGGRGWLSKFWESRLEEDVNRREHNMEFSRQPLPPSAYRAPLTLSQGADTSGPRNLLGGATSGKTSPGEATKRQTFLEGQFLTAPSAFSLPKPISAQNVSGRGTPLEAAVVGRARNLIQAALLDKANKPGHQSDQAATELARLIEFSRQPLPPSAYLLTQGADNSGPDEEDLQSALVTGADIAGPDEAGPHSDIVVDADTSAEPAYPTSDLKKVECAGTSESGEVTQASIEKARAAEMAAEFAEAQAVAALRIAEEARVQAKAAKNVAEATMNERAPIELKVPFCCEGCNETIQNHLIELEGVDSVRLDWDLEKVTITGKVKPEDALKEARNVVRRSGFWPNQREYRKEDDKKK